MRREAHKVARRKATRQGLPPILIVCEGREPHRCGGKGLRRQLPQIPRNHLVAAEGEIARWALTACLVGLDLVPAAGIEPATP